MPFLVDIEFENKGDINLFVLEYLQLEDLCTNFIISNMYQVVNYKTRFLYNESIDCYTVTYEIYRLIDLFDKLSLKYNVIETVNKQVCTHTTNTNNRNYVIPEINNTKLLDLVL